MKKLWIVALCLVLTLALAACGDKPTPDNNPVDSSTPSVEGSVDGGNNGDAGQAGDSGSANVTTTTTTPGNVVDGNLFFGEDPTTTAGNNAGTTTQGNGTTTGGSQGGNEVTLATTAATKTTATTVAPPQQETVQKVKLPAVGYDMDGKGRILVKKSEIKKESKTQYACITFINDSKNTGRAWDIPEYSKVNYVCLDKKGNQLSAGETVVGALEAGQTVECKIELPSGTAEVQLVGHNFEYWTPWS